MSNILVAYADTETTGLSPYQDRIVEVAIVLARVDWESGMILERLDQYDGLQDPGRRIPSFATAIHGITDDMVRGQRIDRRKVSELLLAGDIVLAHGSGFDKGFVAQVVPEVRERLWGCTCRGIPWKRLYPALGNTRLQTLSSHFGSPKGAAHRALGDVETTMSLVNLPGIEGGLAFQHHVLHKKVRIKGLTPRVLAMPDPAFQRQVVHQRAAAFEPPVSRAPEVRIPFWQRAMNRGED